MKFQEALRNVMQQRDCITKAAKLHKQMNAAIEPLNAKLGELLVDHPASVFYQSGDGWCVLFGGNYNAPVGTVDFDVLFQLKKDAALNFLLERSI